MEMTALLEEMAPATPQSPGPEQSSALEEAPEHKAKPSQSARKRKADGCMKVSFAQPPSRSPSPDPPEVLMSPRRVMLPELELADATEKRGAAGRGKGEADEPVARPSKVLRMQMRRSGKGMNGGSSAHNAAPLQRTLSVYVPFERPDDVDPEILFAVGPVTRTEATGTEEAGPETLFAQSHLPALRTPPREVLKLHVDAKFDLHMDELAPFESRNLDFDFEQFTMSD